MHKKRVWLISLREQLGLTQKDVAEKSGISRSTYAEYEAGKKTPSVQAAQKVGDTLGFDWTIFFENNSRNRRQTA